MHTHTEHYYKTMEATAMDYLSDTARLISILDGTNSETKDLVGDDIEKHSRFDAVIYLDKSARPVSWLVGEFWKDFGYSERASKFFKDINPEDDIDVSMPKTSYLNIDRVSMYREVRMDVDDDGYVDDTESRKKIKAQFKNFLDREHNLPKDWITGIRAVYSVGEINENDPDEKVWDMPTRLDGKKILIVDEVKDSGASLEMAMHLLRQAIPDANIICGTHFWTKGGGRSSPVDVEGNTQMGSSPVWYNRVDIGKGIGDPDARYAKERYQKHKTSTAKKRSIGAIVLGATRKGFRNDEDKSSWSENKQGNSQIDPESRALRQDIKYLHDEYRAGKIMFIPPLSGSSDNKIKLALDMQGLSPDIKLAEYREKVAPDKKWKGDTPPSGPDW
jgi:hypothetical protein